MRRLLVLVIGSVLVLHGVVGASAAEVGDGPGAEGEFTALIGQERAARGLGGLTTSAELVDVARRHAARMAADKDLRHNPNLQSEVQNWEVLGENVGRGPSVESIHRAFMDSESHRAQILEPRYTEVGVGVVWSDGEIWVAQVFRKPQAPPPPSPSGEGEVKAAEPAPQRPAPAPAPTAVPSQPRPQPAATAAASAPAAAAVAAAPTPPPVTAAVPQATPAPGTSMDELAAVLAQTVEAPSSRPKLQVAPVAVQVPLTDDVPFVVEIAAGLLLLIVGMQTMTLRRLGLV